MVSCFTPPSFFKKVSPLSLPHYFLSLKPLTPPRFDCQQKCFAVIHSIQFSGKITHIERCFVHCLSFLFDSSCISFHFSPSVSSFSPFFRHFSHGSGKLHRFLGNDIGFIWDLDGTYDFNRSPSLCFSRPSPSPWSRPAPCSASTCPAWRMRKKRRFPEMGYPQIIDFFL